MPNPVSQTLLVVLENQVARTDAALDGLREDVFESESGADCHSICEVGRHLLQLRRFQMTLLESPRAGRVADPASIETVGDLRDALVAAAAALRAAIEEHDAADWYAVPDPPRDGKWGDLPTIERLVRPLNDFTNHLGGIRALRRILGNGCERTQ